MNHLNLEQKNRLKEMMTRVESIIPIVKFECNTTVLSHVYVIIVMHTYL